jgi:hypothetical protein
MIGILTILAAVMVAAGARTRSRPHRLASSPPGEESRQAPHRRQPRPLGKRRPDSHRAGGPPGQRNMELTWAARPRASPPTP